ncbi:MAG: acyl-CoA thioesterase [Chitinophagales bacterium]|nr:acyl-CoA thioesterase [Chitinophagales bacterium]
MEGKEGKLVATSKLVMNEMIMPNDTNPLGNLMGGYLMRWMDIACAICAARHCGFQVVTASVDHISFYEPIKLGDVITLSAQVTRAFNTSVEVYVEVSAADLTGSNPRQSNHAYFTFVALDEVTGKPIQVPQVIPITTEEKKQYEAAIRRRELRLILAGKIKPEQAKELRHFFTEM